MWAVLTLALTIMIALQALFVVGVAGLYLWVAASQPRRVRPALLQLQRLGGLVGAEGLEPPTSAL